MAMELVSRILFGVMAIVGMGFGFLSPCARAQSLAPAPSPSSDAWTSIDQGIAYVLMLVALVLTYLIHPMDASFFNFF